MFPDTTVAKHLAAPVPAAVQRAESSSLLGDRATAAAMAERLVHLVNRTRSAVYIVRPTNGTYTLTSKDSLLPITVVNRLNAEVHVQVSVDSADGDAGLSNPDTDNSFTIKPNSKVQVHMPLHLTRVGRIKLVATHPHPGRALARLRPARDPAVGTKHRDRHGRGRDHDPRRDRARPRGGPAPGAAHPRAPAHATPPAEPTPPVAATTASSVQ